MKKNKFLKLASGLLVLCLLTTCVISTTFAKYVTSDSKDDTARVAKWGVTTAVTIPEDTSLDTQYEKTEPGSMIAITVKSSTADKVVAPGTKGDVINAGIAGTPEVAVRITVTVDVELVGWEEDTVDGTVVGGSALTTFCPLVFTVNRTDYKIDTTNTDAATLELAVEQAIITALNTSSATGAVEGTGLKSVVEYATNTNLGANVDIDWTWAFNGDDKNDTALGNLTTAPTLSISINTLIEQID